ncbi:MAG TPA: methyl-accepting chemotaxis protein, partial [Rubrivivax sp.]|nr:methyl-accepting chemotaxis protein [Rubrivivax sp.]
EVIEAVTGKAREQAGGIVEIGDAVGQLDQMTRQNAALVRDNGGVAQDLREQARRLADAVSAFRLDDQPALASSGPGQSRM